MKLDRYDLLLLAAVQKNARTSQQELGGLASLSTAAVNRRLKVLSREGVIERYTAAINPAALGYSLTVITEVKVENERLDLLDALQKSFLECDQVQQCYYVAGDCDFVLIFLVRSMEQYVELTRLLFLENSNVTAFKTLVSMKRVKVGADVPVEGID